MSQQLADSDISFVEQLIATPTELSVVVRRVGESLVHIDDPVGFSRGVLARLAQSSRASVCFTDGEPIWTRIQPPERE